MKLLHLIALHLHVKLMEKASENIAASVQLLQVHARNLELLSNYNIKEKELFTREEEVQQHLEELRLLQEQIGRNNQDHLN